MKQASIIVAAAAISLSIAGSVFAQTTQGGDRPVGGSAGDSLVTGANGAVKTGTGTVSTQTDTPVSTPNAKGTTQNGPDVMTGADNAHGNSGAGGGVSPAGQ